MNKIIIGKITTSHGVKGDVKIMSYAEKPVDLFSFKNIYNKDNNIIKLKKIGSTTNQNIFIANIENINDKNEADKLRDIDLYIDRNELKNLKDNQFYINDLIGMKAIAENKIGKVVNIFNYGAGDNIEIEWEDKKIENFPFIEKYIKEIKDNTIFIEAPSYI